MRTGWTRIGSWLSALLLAACASAPPPSPQVDDLYAHAPFPPPTERIDADDVFAVSPAMRHYLQTEMAADLRRLGKQQGLIHALYQRSKLQLDYDATVTRNAAQAFDARAGNCLSLVIMTAAFAKELGLSVQYQAASVDATWLRQGDLVLRSNHVNLTLGRRFGDSGYDMQLQIDFLPPEQLRGLRTRLIDESTVVAMYMNNRAVEALAAGRPGDAHAWAREAARQAPGYVGPYVTLGVLHQRHGDLAVAERAYRQALAMEPFNTRALANLAQVLDRAGRAGEAAEARQALRRIEPHPPFHFLELGIAALQRGDPVQARRWLEQEADRTANDPEVHHWLGVAHLRLGDVDEARRQLALAREHSTRAADRERYGAKLATLRAMSAR